MNNRYLVITPEFEYTEIVVDGQGPTYVVKDVVEIEAKSRRDAISLGVKYMLTHRYPDGQRFQYVHDQKASGQSPYTGVLAELYPEEEEL